jgi:hypothetical protein
MSKGIAAMSKPGMNLGPGIGWGELADCPIGIRHEGGVTLIQAVLIRSAVIGKNGIKAKQAAQGAASQNSPRTAANGAGSKILRRTAPLSSSRPRIASKARCGQARRCWRPYGDESWSMALQVEG